MSDSHRGATPGADVAAAGPGREAPRASDAFHRAVEEASPDVAVVIGPAYCFRFVSASCMRQLGYSVEEMIANGPLALAHPDDRDRLERTLEHLLATDGARVEQLRWRVRHRDGTWRHVEGVARNQLAPPVGGVVVNTRDVTEQVRLAARVHHVREEQKARIARDLHDQLGSLLTALKLDLAWLEERLDALPAGPAVNTLVDHAVEASELAERTITEVQRIATDLRPAALDRLGLGAALRQEGRRFQARTSVECAVEVDDALPALDDAVATALYRIAQEALTNVARHARATRVAVRLSTAGERVVLSVEDDGVGIAAEDADAPRAIGVAGMRERAALEGGELSIDRRREGGTRVAARLPLRAAVEDGT